MKTNAMKMATLRAQGRCFGWALMSAKLGMVVSSDFCQTEDEARIAYEREVDDLVTNKRGTLVSQMVQGAYVVLCERVSARRILTIAESVRKFHGTYGFRTEAEIFKK